MKLIKQMMLVGFITFFNICVGYADSGQESYSSFLVNQSNQGATAYVLVKTRTWPQANCIIASGQTMLSPGEKTELVIAKIKGCDQAGVGYSMYKKEDAKHKQLLGYVSHRFRDGKFSIQISMFCKSKECIFKDLSPEQNKAI